MSNPSEARRERIKQLFADAIAIPPVGRGAMIDVACAGDEELRTAVGALLDNYDSAREFFAQFPEKFGRDVLGLGDPPRTFSAGELVAGRFRIVGFLGAGGMGEVYEAEDLVLNLQHLALKTLPVDIAVDATAIARLKQEIVLGRQVTHVNVCRVFDVDEHVSAAGAVVAFFTMELLRGETLAARLERDGALTPSDARPLIAQMVAALAAAHAAGIVHGDFKPGNVMIVPASAGEERLVVTDFGLARQTPVTEAARSGITSVAAWGTPVYMAPEQFAGRRATRATDVYTLTAVILELLTGKPGVDPGAADPTRLPPRWRSAIARGLEHNPAARFETVGELWTALAESDREPMPTNRRRWIAAAAGLGVVLVLSIPIIREQAGARTERRSTALAVPQQIVAVVPSISANPGPDEEVLARGVAAATGEQLDGIAGSSAAFRFVRTGPIVQRGVSSAVQVHRTLGADLMVTIAIGEASPNLITLELHRASAQPSTLMRSRRLAMRDGERILSLVRAEVAELLGIRVVPSAIGAFEGRVGRWSAQAEEWYVRGRGYLEEGRAPALELRQLDLAIAAFERVIELDAEHAPARAGLSEALVSKYEATKNSSKDTRLLDAAAQSVSEACRLQPNVAHFHVVRALTYLATGRHDLAIPALEEALLIDPDAADARENLARSYIATDQLARAERTLDEAVAAHPEDWSAHEALGALRVNQGQYRDAEAHFLIGRRYAPDNLRVIGNLAGLYTMTELTDAAEQELTRGVKLAADPILYNNLGWAYFYQGSFEKGVESMTEAARLSQRNSIVLAGLARGYRWVGRRDATGAAYTAAIMAANEQIRADPLNVVVRANLAYLYAETGDRGEAGRQIERALEDGRSNVRVRFTSALVFELLGRRQAALDALTSAIDGGHPTYQIARHPDLRNLRLDDRYVELIGRRTARPGGTRQ